MSQRVDPTLADELKEYGAVGLEMCIHCGNCTAICSLSTEDARFPRQLMRMAQLGLRDQLLGSKELWLCYNCGDCSETCPQQAEPANLMAAARSYAIAQYAPFKIGALFFKKTWVGSLIAAVLVLFFGVFLYGERGAMATDSLKLFGFIPYAVLHTVGLAVLLLIGVISLVTILTMMSRIIHANHLSGKDVFNGSGMNGLQALWEAVVVQSLGQKRYRQECTGPGNQKSWYLRIWFVHAAAMWGFLGLLLATVMDYGLDALGLKTTGAAVAIWYPTRLIGTLAGLLFTYGVTILLYKRWRPEEKAHRFSRPYDWLFLSLLWLSGTSGLLIEIALYLPGAPVWGYWMFISHVAVSMVLLLLMPFTKFAHAIYRIAAIYIFTLKPAPERETVPAGTE